jgi:hypothetical protein
LLMHPKNITELQYAEVSQRVSLKGIPPQAPPPHPTAAQERMAELRADWRKDHPRPEGQFWDSAAGVKSALADDVKVIVGVNIGKLNPKPASHNCKIAVQGFQMCSIARRNY